MSEIVTKEIGVNQISNSFKKVKDYYLYSLENGESIFKKVEDELFDGYSFQEVKDYYKKKTIEMIDDFKDEYGYDCTKICEYIYNNPSLAEKINNFLYKKMPSIDPSTVITGQVKSCEYGYVNPYKMVEIIDFKYEANSLAEVNLRKNIPSELIKDILGFYKSVILSFGVQIHENDINNLEKISKKIQESWKARSDINNLKNIVCGKFSEKVYKQKVYFSLLKNKLVFSQTKCEDLLLIAELKTNTKGFELFNTCVQKDDMKDFYDYVVKRIISGFK